MGKNNESKKTDGFSDVYQDPVNTEDRSVPGEAPSSPSTGGSDAAMSAAKLKKRISVLPSAEVDVQKNVSSGGDAPDAITGSRVAAGFGGRADRGDASRIPYRKEGKSPNSIDGKRNFEAARALDDTSSEFVLPVVDEAASLHEKSNAEQVYNGRKIFIKERGKKNVTDGPQCLLFNASSDLDISSFVVASTGQVVGDVSPEADYPVVNFNGENLDIPMKKGNYLLEKLNFTIEDGRITNISFKETKYDAPTTFATSEESNFNWKIDRNNVAKAMDQLQLKYGNPLSNEWSPLGYAIQYPYEHNMLLHDIEATTGAIAATAIRAAVSSLAYQHNIVSKEGTDSKASVVRMFLEGYAGSIADSSSVANPTDIKSYVFNRNAYKQGSAAAIIPLFDSTSKYTEKSHFFTFPGGLGKTVSEGLSHYKPLRVKPQFMKVLDKAHMFSTMDGQYSPVLPVYTTRSIHLINPMSLNYFLQGWKHPDVLRGELRKAISEGKADAAFMREYNRYDEKSGIKAIYGYSYIQEDNRYYVRIVHPIVEGIVKWMLDHEHKIASVYGDGEVSIPCGFNFMYPSMFQHIVCSALGTICKQRKDPLLDILQKSMSSSDYVWKDLEKLENIDPLKSSQLVIKDKDNELSVGKLSDDSKLRLLWGSNFHRMGGDGNDFASYMMPWYVSDKSFKAHTSHSYLNKDGFKDYDNYAKMNFPSIRRGVNHQFVDLLHDFSESEVRLALDRYLDIPLYTTRVKANPDDGVMFDTLRPDLESSLYSDGKVQLSAVKYDQLTSGRVVVRYDTDHSMWAGGLKPIVEDSIFTIPKELGWIWDATPSMVSVVESVEYEVEKNADPTIKIEYYRFMNKYGKDYEDKENMTGGTAREIRSFRSPTLPNPDGHIVQGSATYQAYKTGYADCNMHEVNKLYTDYIGIALDNSYEKGAFENKKCFFVPGSTVNSDDGKFHEFLQSNARVMWSMLQRTFIPDSPFYNCYDSIDAQKSDEFIWTDPLEQTFYFGVCGMIPTDYMTAVRCRLDISDQLDSDYTEDVYTEKSFLFR